MLGLGFWKITETDIESAYKNNLLWNSGLQLTKQVHTKSTKLNLFFIFT